MTASPFDADLVEVIGDARNFAISFFRQEVPEEAAAGPFLGIAAGSLADDLVSSAFGEGSLEFAARLQEKLYGPDEPFFAMQP